MNMKKKEKKERRFQQLYVVSVVKLLVGFYGQSAELPSYQYRSI